MGLFSKNAPEENDETIVFDKQDAMAGILIVALNAGDGGEEIEFAMDMISRMQLFRNQSDETFTAMIDKLLKVSSEQGLTALFKKSLAALPADLHETAFALTTDIFFFSCGGVVDDEKREWLGTIQKLLKIPDALAVKIVEVMQLKYRG